jgi:hypothetical protein
MENLLWTIVMDTSGSNKKEDGLLKTKPKKYDLNELNA